MVNRVKEMRAQLGMSRIELSRKAGISVVTVDYLEKASNYDPHARTMKAVSDALGARVTEVFTF